MTETQSTCKVNTNVSHESVKLCDMDFSWTNKCIPLPLLKKIDCTKYLKQNYLLVTLKQMSNDFKIIYTACPILPYIEYDELLYPFKYMKCIWLPRSVPSFNTFAELQIS